MLGVHKITGGFFLKILISRPDKIGDVVLALHGAKQLKHSLPNCQVYLHVSEYTRPLVENVTFIDGCVIFGEDLSKYNFDAVVDLMAKYDTAKHYASNDMRHVIGNAARWFSYLYHDRAVVRRSYAKMNEAEYNWRLIRLVDDSLANVQLNESLNIEDFDSINAFENTKPYIVLMPGVSVSAKPWPRDKWISLANKLAAENDKDVIFIGGPAETNELSEIEKLITNSSNIRCFQTQDFKTLLGILKGAVGYVGPSTGITHLASAANLHGVALYPSIRSMHPRRWQPFRSSLRVLTISQTLSANDVSAAFLKEAAKKQPGPYKEQISAFIICLNEEDNIERALKSVAWCDEIIIVDSGSTDKTIQIASKYTNKIISRPWPGHVAQKQFGLSQCSCEWVLNIDADEEVSPELHQQIDTILSDSTPFIDRFAGFRISRVVRFLGRWWDKCGWHPEYRLRLVRASHTTWGGIDPHEKAIAQGRTGKLTGALYHYTYANIADQIDRLNKFSSSSAASLTRQGKQFYLFNLITNPIFRFFKFYIFKRGFLEGSAGLIVAVNEAVSTFLKYAKLWEISQEKKQAFLKNKDQAHKARTIQTSSSESNVDSSTSRPAA